MGVFTQLVRSNGNEPVFIKKFIHTVLAADDRIKCDKTDAQIDEMFYPPTAGLYPEFTFTVGDLYTIRLRRFFEAGASATDGYSVYMTSLANAAGEVSWGLYFSIGREYSGVATARQFWLRVVSSEKAVLIIFGNHDNPIPDGYYRLRCIGYKDGTTIGFSAQKNYFDTERMGSFFYIGSEKVTPVERLYFKNDPSDTRKAVVGKDKVMKNSSSYKQSVTSALCDVSIIPSFLQKEIKAGDKHYFVVTQTELMPL